jgi:hypothetical protein
MDNKSQDTKKQAEDKTLDKILEATIGHGNYDKNYKERRNSRTVIRKRNKKGNYTA